MLEVIIEASWDGEPLFLMLVWWRLTTFLGVVGLRTPWRGNSRDRLCGRLVVHDVLQSLLLGSLP